VIRFPRPVKRSNVATTRWRRRHRFEDEVSMNQTCEGRLRVGSAHIAASQVFTKIF
jgi:hypothetical protein